jgi:hypothetical protein
MEAQQQSKVADFVNVTGSNAQEAQFYLDASKWDLEASTSSHF